MSLDAVVHDAQVYLRDSRTDGWLVYDYRGMNPIFQDTLGRIANVTRPCWLWVPAEGDPRLLVSYVDQGRFSDLALAKALFVSRAEMESRLAETLRGARRVAMEYTPEGALPRVSKVDAGTLELVRGLGVEVVPSADLLQFATQRWGDAELESHLLAADRLSRIVHEAFDYIADRLGSGSTEYEAAEFIRGRFVEEGLEVTDGPVVAANEHSSDPHFEPTAQTAATIVEGDWVLIDLWSRMSGEESVFADITWTGYVGPEVPARNQEVFDAVIGARDAALAVIERSLSKGNAVPGWEVDRVARDYIDAAGFGQYFNHRLGHSLGREVHGNAVNLDGWETHDTRRLIPGLAVTIEPGIYLPEFGVRSEIDVYIGEDGPRVTTEVQREVVRIGA